MYTHILVFFPCTPPPPPPPHAVDVCHSIGIFRCAVKDLNGIENVARHWIIHHCVVCSSCPDDRMAKISLTVKYPQMWAKNIKHHISWQCPALHYVTIAQLTCTCTSPDRRTHYTVQLSRNYLEKNRNHYRTLKLRSQ